MPNERQMMVLIRTTLLTFNDAVQTGNYTVLRDMAAPGFREANSAARLSKLFEPFASSAWIWRRWRS